MLMNLSVSARLPKLPPYNEYEWFIFKGVRGVMLENKEYHVSVDVNERYGVHIAGKGRIFVVHDSDPSVVFEADPKTARSLMGRSKPYKGRVKGKAVNNTRLRGNLIETGDEIPEEKEEPPRAVAGAGAKDVLALIRKQPFHKPRSITYMRKGEDVRTDSTIYYYDASTSFRESLKSDEDWIKFAEKLLLTAMAGRDYLVGAHVVPATKSKATTAVLMVGVPQ